ncbi:MAG: FecR domain-containing protein [Niabella sp.]
MDRQRLIELLTKRESGVITLPETRELNEYLKANPDDQQVADALKEMLNGTFRPQRMHEYDDIDERLKKLHESIKATNTEERVFPKKQGRGVRIFVRFIAAAVLVLALGLGIFHFYLRDEEGQPQSQNILATKKGSKLNLMLPDGTKVLLNADSRLAYDLSFGKKLREVTLEGEAYFEVAKDSKHPFIVHTKEMDVKVLGTVFNVRAYSSESNTAATLLRGSVEVTLNKRSNRNVVVLKPNEKIIVNNKENNTIKKPTKERATDIAVVSIKINSMDSSVLETQWTKNRLVFDQTDYGDVFPELERWYGISVIVKDSSVLKRKISGIYENESLTEVLESFKLATGFKYNIEDNNLTIYK